MKELGIIKSTQKTGKEKLTYKEEELDYSINDFWRWSASDLISNAMRGRFAEFIVCSAIGSDLENVRNEWDAYDLITPQGIKIEVKSSAYIQSWKQNTYSKISFSIKPSKYWDAKNNTTDSVAKRQADIYIFCLLKHKEQSTIDALKMEQWEFYVTPTYILNNYGENQKYIGLNMLKKLIEPVEYIKLSEEIEKVFEKQKLNNKDNQQST